MYNGKTKISLRIVLVVIKVASKYASSPIKLLAAIRSELTA